MGRGLLRSLVQGQTGRPRYDRPCRLNSEDGNLYAIRSNGTLRDHLFLNSALGAAYTPMSIGNEGKILTQSNGHLYVVGGDDD